MTVTRLTILVLLAIVALVPTSFAGGTEAPPEVVGVDAHALQASRVFLCGTSVLERDLDETQRLFDSEAFRSRAAAQFGDRPEMQAAFELTRPRFSIKQRKDGCLDIHVWRPTYIATLRPGSFGRRFSERRRHPSELTPTLEEQVEALNRDASDRLERFLEKELSAWVREKPVSRDSDGWPITEWEGRPVHRYTTDGKVTQPRRVDGPLPEYPAAAKRARIWGTVILDAVVAEDGTLATVKVVRGLPLGMTEAAVEAVRQWRFEPGTLDGEPVMVSTAVEAKFTLDENEKPDPALLELRFPEEDTASRELVVRAGYLLHMRLADEIPDDVHLRSLIVRTDTVYINGSAATDAAIRRFVARLEASTHFTEVALESTTRVSDTLWRFRIGVNVAE